LLLCSQAVVTPHNCRIQHPEISGTLFYFTANKTAMRKLKLQVSITLDGFIGGPNGEMDWMTMPWTEDLNAYVTHLLAPVDTIVLGRKLAEGFIPYWAGVAADSNNPEQGGGITFTNTPKVVFSKTIEPSAAAEKGWPNTVITNTNLAEEIARLKGEEGGDIYACGGASFVSSLIQLNLVDEYYLLVNPVAIGSGLSIFKNRTTPLHLNLIKATAFKCGIVALHYQAKKS
jgi:dihydrofolate reductase